MKERVLTFRTDMALRNTRTIVLNEGEANAKREEIRRYFHATYDIDEALLETLKFHETFYRRADPLRHPLIFYFGHTATFFINKLILAKLVDRRINPEFESMFAVGVDEMSWDDLNTDAYEWPSVDEVQAYRDTVRGVVDRVIATAPLTMPITWDNPFWVVMMGIEHARIHLETSSVLIRQLPLDQLRAHPLWEVCGTSGDAPVNKLIDVKGSKLVLGKEKDHPLYGWDNEFGVHEAEVSDFKASKYLVSNGEYLDFVTDRGYATDAWWTEEGRAWKSYVRREHPIFWIPDGGSYRMRTMLREIAMPWDWPVEVNQLEAAAFCKWKAAGTGRSIRLPTEEEWYVLRDACMDSDQPYWIEAPGNINLEHYASSCPVTEHVFGDFCDVVGNAWQWTETPISGFRGFDVHACYDDFSTPTFDTQHNLMKGGSWISTGNEATRDSRYAFRRHFIQHAGLRYVAADAPVIVAMDVYETDAVICQYCDFHYGEPCLDVPNFPKAVADICIELTATRSRTKALDLGCAVGRSSFELARAFNSVLGADFSANIIRVGADLKEKGYIQYTRLDEGELVTYHEKSLEDFGFEACCANVEFMQADACNLKELYTGYDLILASNLIDRLYSPRKFLEKIHERLTPRGLLVLLSPYTWLEEFTERDEWIGGFRKDGEPYSTLEGLHNILGQHLSPVGEPRDIPFVIRETARKHQHTISQMTVWEKIQ